MSESTAKYASGGDGAAWTSTKTRPNGSAGWTTTWTRNIGDLGGGLGILQSSDGTARLQLSDLRGNVVGSATIGGTAIDSYASYTEYGLARTAVPAEYEGYGWLGRHARKSAGNVGGVTLMGARLYNPTTGRFLSRDSVEGGNDNSYVYPPDPINKIDLDGRSWIDAVVKAIIKAVVKVVAKVVRKAVAIRKKPTLRKKSASKKCSARCVEGDKSGRLPYSPGGLELAQRMHSYRSPLTDAPTTYRWEQRPRSDWEPDLGCMGAALGLVYAAATAYAFPPASVGEGILTGGLPGVGSAISTYRCFFG